MNRFGVRLLSGPHRGLSSRQARVLVAGILLVAAFLRFRGLDWDDGNHLHPDERFISMVAEKITAPGSLAGYFDSARSPLNPYNRGEASFVYGTFPLFLTKAVSHAVGMSGYGGAYKVGRALSGLFDLLTVWLVYRLSRRLTSRGGSLLASGLFAFAPLAIQSSHFWTVETFLAALSTLTLLGCVRMAAGRSTPLQDLATGLALGLAVACKVTALALLGPLGLAALLRSAVGSEAGRGTGGPRWKAWLVAAEGLGLALFGAAAAVRCALPYVFLGPSPLSFRIDPRYLADLENLARLSSSFAGFPPALQWADRSILFPIRNFVLWGAGPCFGLAALAGVAWAVLALRRRSRWLLAPLLLHVAILFAYHGTALVKSIRYFFPAYPVLAVLAALFLCWLGGPGRPALIRAVPAVVLAGSVLAGFAFASIYSRPHTRVTASRWIQQNVPSPARIANESWDDGLPLALSGLDVRSYAGPVLDHWVPEDPRKVDAIASTLERADWVAVTSGRVYANVTRIPDVYPVSVAYYRALFGGELGFRPEADFSSYPSLGPLPFPSDGAEEQFTVYDHPRVLLFRKSGDFSAARVRALLTEALGTKPPTIWEWEKLPRSERRTAEPVRPGRRPGVESALRVDEPVRTDPEPPRTIPGSPGATGVWLGTVLLLGALAAPIVFRLFPLTGDRGLGLAKTVGLLVPTLASAVLLRLEVFGEPRPTALFALFLTAVLSAASAWSIRRDLARFARERARLILTGEVVFLLGFALFLGLRSLNPEIAWGEKPMDFSLLNVLVRTSSLPVSDPWLAGAPLGYYTFGHQAIAFLTLVTGLPTRLTYNLAIGLLGGLVAQGAFSLAASWGGRIRAGLAAAAFVGLFGNLAGLREWLLVRRPGGLPLDWHYFWATSRVVPDTINEYPFWSLLFADLHAHVLSIPFFFLVAAAALELVLSHAGDGSSPLRRLGAALVLGTAVAVQALTNAWDIPFLAGLVVLTGLVAARSGRDGARPAFRALWAVAAAAGMAAALFAALRWRAFQGPGHGWNGEAPASLADVVTVFGLFFFLAFAWWFAWARDERRAAGGVGPSVLAGSVLAALLLSVSLRSAAPLCAAGVAAFVAVALRKGQALSVRLAAGFVAAGFFLVLFPQYAYVSDRMNTFFKLYLEAWLAFAVGTAVLVFGGAGRPGTFPSWPRAVRGLFGLLAGASLFTSLTAARGALGDARPTYRAGAPRPTLDGLAYLERTKPGELEAVEWLQEAVTGTPVLLEAQGPSYQDFSRISMLTGIPTVLGWEHHVSQRGIPRSEIDARRAAVATIYTHPGTGLVEPLLRRYRVEYVYVGWLERATYPPAGLLKFATAGALFEEVFANRDVRIYRVLGAGTAGAAALLRPTVREAPEPGAAADADGPEEPPVFRESPLPASAPFAGLREPRAVAVDGTGRLWVTDFGNSKLRVFDESGGLLGGWGGRGSGRHGLREPSGIAIRGDRVLIADTWNGRVASFDVEGAWKGSADGLYGPRGVAFGAGEQVWVADTGNHRVLRYDDLATPPLVLGSRGPGLLQFSSPVGIAVGPSGLVYVADGGNSRVQILHASGKHHSTVPVPQWKGAIEPQLAVDEAGRLFVTSPSSEEVIAFDSSGGLLWTRARDDEGRPFRLPVGIVVDEKRKCLWVVNAGNDSVARLSLATPAK